MTGRILLRYNTVTCAKCFGTFREILTGSIDLLREKIRRNEATGKNKPSGS